MVMTLIGLLGMYVFGWVIGFVTCTLASAVRQEQLQTIKQNRTKVSDLYPEKK